MSYLLIGFGLGFFLCWLLWKTDADHIGRVREEQRKARTVYSPVIKTYREVRNPRVSRGLPTRKGTRMADSCPTCGEPVVVVTGDEGTSHYESAARAEIARLREALKRIAEWEQRGEDEGQPDFYDCKRIARAALNPPADEDGRT